MAERPLQEVLADPPSTRVVPVWAWGCGAGCLMLVLLAIGATWYSMNLFQKTMGPEAAWPIVKEVMPFDERPQNYQAFLVPFKGMAGFVSRRMGVEDEDLQLLADLDLVTVLDPREDTVMSLFVGTLSEEMEDRGRDAGERKEIELQGRTVSVLHYRAEEGRDRAFQIGAVPGAMVYEFELAPLGDRPVRVSVLRTRGELNPEYLQRFLEPFDLWARGGPPEGGR